MWLPVVVVVCLLIGISADTNDTTTGSKCPNCKDNLCTDGRACDNGCRDGLLGTTCDDNCPARCVSCDHTNTTCIECDAGFYDQFCEKKCSLHCKDVTCDKITGTCDGGCEEGYSGDKCCVNQGPCEECSSSTVCKKCSRNFQGEHCNQCERGLFGPNCTSTCPENCVGRQCDKTNGDCIKGCTDSFTGDKCCIRNGHCQECSLSRTCYKCKYGFYGPDCSKPCSDGCRDRTCHRDSGNCLHNCTAGFYGDKCCLQGGYCSICESNTECSKCKQYSYGVNCDKLCSRYCKQRECNSNNGICTLGCVNGHTGDKCCSSGHCKTCLSPQECLACEDGYFGHSCDQRCSIGCNMRKCNKKTGVCTNGCETGYSGDLCCVNGGNCDKCSSKTNCERCVNGYYGSQCNITCSTGCRNNTCGQNNGKCTEKCKLSYTGDRCCQRDGFCQVCKNGDTCLHCMNGFYGRNCDKNCSNGCIHNKCKKRNGKCSQLCKYGYSGDKCCLRDGNCSTCKSNTECSKCKRYYYGQNCNQRCPYYCKKGLCDRNHGICTRGCIQGYKGDKCCSTGHCKQCLSDRQCSTCDDGYYGSSCLNRCSDGCNSHKCIKETGFCRNGCKAGYYGDSCNIPCSAGCNALQCKRKTGVCTNGCKDGYSGDLCCIQGDNCEKCSSKTICKHCKTGFYGYECKSSCSNGCMGNTCYRNDGTCTQPCKPGYTGDRCCQHNGKCKICKTNSECSECTDGYFGINCNRTCSEGCLHDICRKHNGRCWSCKYGYSGDMCCLKNANCENCSLPTQCSKCKTGFYGDTCAISCPRRCHNGSCNMNSGICFECTNGYYGSKCDQSCSNNCRLNECSLNGTCYSCKDGFYGHNCTNKCHENCKSCTAYELCDACQDGFYGKDCRSKCPANCLKCTSGEQCESCMAGYKGAKCEEQCSKCKPGTKCRSNGYCIEACRAGYTSTDCDRKCDPKCKVCQRNNARICIECANGRYGHWYRPYSYSYCTYSCSKNCLNNSCNADSGDCNNCIDGYHGLKCDCPTSCEQCDSSGNCRKCKAPLANPGRSCECRTDMCNSLPTNVCSSCTNATWFADMYSSSCCPCKKECKNSLCVSKDICTNGCEDGYYGHDCSKKCSSTDQNCLSCISTNKNGFNCKRCEIGYFLDGIYCETCPHTCNNETCDPTNGTCTLGCKQRFWGTNCKRYCKSSSCLQCRQHNGDCLVCTDGRYGKNCSGTCSSNCATKNSRIHCNISDGSCSHGCSDKRLYGKQCRQRCSTNCTDQECAFPFGQCSKGCVPNQYGEFCNHTCSDTCKTDQGHSDCHSTNGTCAFGCLNGFFGDRCEEMCGIHCVNSTCERNSGHCVLGCMKGFDGLSCSEALASTDTDTTPSIVVVAAVVAVAVIGLVVAVLVIFLFYKRKRNTNATLGQEEREDISLERINPSPAGAANAEVNAAYENVGDFSKTRIPKENIVDYVANNVKETFTEEFMLFPTGLTKPYEESQKPRNMIRNRYATIYPYDHTRVILKGTDNDYINANYIHGYNKPREYIACLGPTSKVMVEFKIFWYMVWQEKVEKIVMLTNLHEPSGMKCEQYWPEPGTIATYGDVTVTCRDENTFTDYVLKSMTVTKNGETRLLYHIHYTAWPDKSIPNDVISMINFQQRVASLRSSLGGPIVVHCSAGVGRTGTFIALDYLCQQADTEDAVDIFRCVRTLRAQRTTMVQKAEQYLYLHLAVAVFASSDCHAIRSECFADYVITLDSTVLQAMFTKLDTSMQVIGNEEAGAVQRNRSHTDINHPCADIPGDLFRPRLHLNKSRRPSEYINAVYFNSHTTKNQYILTQSPLKDGIEDFLTLVLQEKCSVIVDLDPVMPQCNQQPRYLVENNKSKDIGSVKITCGNVKNSSHFVQRDLRVEMGGQGSANALDVKHFQYSNWSSCHVVPESPEEFIKFVRGVEREAGKATIKGPLLIHCRNAAERSCLFYVVALLLQKIETDHEVSVITSVLQTRTRRRLAIPNMEQFLFCHHCVEAYLQTFETYSNFLAK